ncbi:hypothetical protein ACKUB1_02155 [Methanospirillum stamsii]|uniref:Uncharacterized protein n=1 Tax=Methanospirillum stamsii TaxID=1277351 RepID=A0A2V2N5P0_9EURY|nr:hypothetical protein [Methanospirillum stamsii]PWR70831.1 hypothetical protein DLD82_15195 [Methanospirillum stamsii]
MTITRKFRDALTCVPMNDSDRERLTVRMSPGSRKILEEIKWSERGFVPSFEHTDKILMEAARRTYQTLVLSDR